MRSAAAAAWVVLLVAWAAPADAQRAPATGTWILCGVSGEVHNLGAPSEQMFRLQLVDLLRSDPSLPTMMEGTPVAGNQVEGSVRRVLTPGSTCRGTECPAGTLTWNARMIRWSTTAGGAVEGGGALTFEGPGGTCTGSWTAGVAPPAADVELLLRLSNEPPGSIDDLRALGDPTGVAHWQPILLYGRPEQYWVTVREARRRSDGQRIDRGAVLPAEIEMRFDGRSLGTAVTDGNGTVAFDVMPPEDAPQGRSHHRIEIFARRGEATGLLLADAVVQRGLQEIIVAVEGVPSPQLLGSTLSLRGRVLAVASGLFLDPVESWITVRAREIGRDVAVETDASGFFSIPVQISSQRFDAGYPDSPEHRWTSLNVEAAPKDPSRYLQGSSSVRFLLLRQGVLSATLLVDRPAYFPDDLDPVTVGGTVTADGEPSPATVHLSFDGQPLATVEAGADGRFQHRFAPSTMTPGERPGTEHTILAVARRTGYVENPPAFATLLSGDRSAGCSPGQALVKATGRGWVSRPGEGGARRSWDLPERSGAAPGSMIEAGSAPVTVAFEVGDGAGITAVAAPGTRLEIARYCRDASGRVRIRLVVDKPGDVVIDRRTYAGGSANYQVEVVTPAVTIADVRTRYLVHVDALGATTVVVLDGAVAVGGFGGGAIEVAAREQVTVRPGETAERERVGPVEGEIDPRLVAALEASGGDVAGDLPGAGAGTAGSGLSTAELEEMARAVLVEGRWILVRTDAGAFLISRQQLEDHVDRLVATGAIRFDQRDGLVEQWMRSSQEGFRQLIQPEIDARAGAR